MLVFDVETFAGTRGINKPEATIITILRGS